MIEGFTWNGEWKEVIECLDQLAGGRFTIPIGTRPPIVRKDDMLIVTNRGGDEYAYIGDRVVLDRATGEFHVLEAKDE